MCVCVHRADLSSAREQAAKDLIVDLQSEVENLKTKLMVSASQQQSEPHSQKGNSTQPRNHEVRRSKIELEALPTSTALNPQAPPPHPLGSFAEWKRAKGAEFRT